MMAAAVLMNSALNGALFALPASIQWDSSLQQMTGVLKDACRLMRVRPINPPFLKTVQHRQDQIDCEGLPFEGAERHAEFVFRDDKLVMTWIMTRADEDPHLEDAMTAAYGAPSKRSEKYVVYARSHAALRLDKHEVLFYAPALVDEITTWF